MDELQHLKSKYLNENDLTKHSETEFNQIFAEWKNAQHNYIETKILQQAVLDVLYKNKANALETYSGICYSSAVYDAMILTECIEGLSSKNLIGIKENDIREVLSNAQNIMRESETIQNDVEKQLKWTFEELYKSFMHKASLEADAKSLVVAKVLQLGSNIADKMEEYKTKEENVKCLLQTKSNENQVYLGLLLQNATLLKEIMEKFKIQLKPEKDKITFKSLVSRIESLLTKLQRVSCKTKNETYTEENISVLQKTLQCINQETNEKTLHKSSLQHQIYGYGVLGDEYQSIVTDYSKLQAEINKNNWFLDNLTQKIDEN